MQQFSFAIFGTGTMASIYAKIISQRLDCRVVAFVGNTLEKTEVLASAYGVPGFSGSDYNTMFKEVKDIDAVIIATPEWIREQPLVEAIKNNVHILLEKPFADSWEESKKLETMLANYPKVLGMCHVLRYSPRFNAMKKAIEQNEIGNVRHIYARRNSNNVRVSRVLGKTSLAFWLTPHDIDMIQGIVPDRIKKVFVSTRDKAKTNDDFIIAHLIFEGGVSAVLEISWCGPPVSGMSREAIFEVRGNRGNLEVADYDMNIRIFKGDQKVFVEDTYEDFKLYEQYRGYFFDLIDDYIRRIRIGKPNKNELKQVLETTRICEMIRISIEEERIVDSLEVS